VLRKEKNEKNQNDFFDDANECEVCGKVFGLIRKEKKEKIIYNYLYLFNFYFISFMIKIILYLFTHYKIN
jgi:hypothetical protein